MFDRRWILLALLLILLGILLAAPALSLISSCILVLFPAAHWWNRRALRGVTYERILSHTRAFPGESLRLTLQINNRKFLPVPWLRIQDEFPRAVSPVDAESGEGLLAPSHEQERGFLVSLLSLRWYERVRRRYSLLDGSFYNVCLYKKTFLNKIKSLSAKTALRALIRFCLQHYQKNLFYV